ncbi:MULTISPECIES: hypothetical protein [Agrobacterium]|jgi:hypothetical protein|uniref:Uncharacterized protein n=2 Tax=Agrobacterium tumefaciens complex TaxID=1183400 RepID=A0AAE6EIT7_AGRTU|nr:MULTISPECIES: hypothetical protein [Agrobacterium]QCL77482.1 hypothetical protein CFBP5499_28915 [Agrobacterium tumefaciens]QCL82970.1 hypothetical protein CFBP5877_28080 [Agrobacterium tumefaciens]
MDWSWVRRSVRSALVSCGATEALSSLAEGSDQVFAEVALDLSIPLRAVVPFNSYEAFFQDAHVLLNYRRLLGQARRVDLNLHFSPERAFFEAGKFIVDECQLLIAVWDGRPAEGFGGTADIVTYSRSRGRRLIWLDPFKAEIHREGSMT